MTTTTETTMETNMKTMMATVMNIPMDTNMNTKMNTKITTMMHTNMETEIETTMNTITKTTEPCLFTILGGFAMVCNQFFVLVLLHLRKVHLSLALLAIVHFRQRIFTCFVPKAKASPPNFSARQTQAYSSELAAQVE